MLLLRHTLVLAIAATAAAQSLHVQSTTPIRNGFLDPMQPIAITFQQAIQPATVTTLSFAVLGRWSGPIPGTTSVDATGHTVTFQPSRPAFVGEWVTVTLASSIRSASNQPLTGGFSLHLYATSTPGTRQFAAPTQIAMRRSGEGNIGTYGVYAGDLDRDGAPDLVAMNEVSHDLRVLKNDGCGNFGAITLVANPNQWPSPNEGADFDRDGWLDIATGNQNGQGVSIFLNNGSGGLRAPTVYSAFGYVHGVACGDFNGDGYWDFACANTTSNIEVYLNQGNGTFASAGTFPSGGIGTDNMTVLDANEDGWPDIVVGCASSGTAGVLLGQGNGTFTLSQSIGTGGSPFHVAVADVNGDHHVDLLFANRSSNTLGVLMGRGDGTFAAAVTYPVGSAPAAVDLGDLDGDGHVDAVVSNYAGPSWTVWWNRGDGVFVSPLTLPAPQSGSCATLVDYDRDGYLDIIGTDETADVAVLFRHTSPPLNGTQPTSCGAALRVNQRADRAGLAGRAPAPLTTGIPCAVGISGPANLPVVLAVGFPGATGTPLLGAGLLNLNAGLQITVIDNGLIPGGGSLDAKGEYLHLLTVPSGFPGVDLCFQGLVGNLGSLLFTNAQTVRTLN